MPMLDEKIINSIKRQPLTKEQIYQDYPFEDEKLIDNVLTFILKDRRNRILLIDGYFQERRYKRFQKDYGQRKKISNRA